MTKYILAFLLILIPFAALAQGPNCAAQLKQGAEARCMPGVDEEEFSEDAYTGAFSLGPNTCVFIEDARKRSGHLVLHADCLGLHCPLYRFNRFIYVYGPSPGSPEPVQGTVTFVSDGSQVTQIILQHEGKEAYFPRRSPGAAASPDAQAVSAVAKP